MFKEIFTEAIMRKSGKSSRKTTKATKAKIIINEKEFTTITNAKMIKDAYKDEGLDELTISASKISRGYEFTSANNLQYFVKEQTNHLDDNQKAELRDALTELATKLLQSKPLKKALLKVIEEELEEKDYRTYDVLSILEKGNAFDIARFSVYDIDVDVKRGGFNSTYGSHDTKETTGTFTFNNKSQEVNLGSSISGTSW